jgi:hypothetical protein
MANNAKVSGEGCIENLSSNPEAIHIGNNSLLGANYSSTATAEQS